MKLFLPNARAINWLLIVGFCSIGYALYMRYLAVEQSTIGLSCQAGLNTWLCFTRQVTIVLFTYSVFGWVALIVATLNLLRPSLVLFALALAAASCGVSRGSKLTTTTSNSLPASKGTALSALVTALSTCVHSIGQS